MKAEQKRFDFDEWRELFEASPERFEEKRRETIEAAIGLASKSQQVRLRGLQWRIDTVRSRHKHPIASTAKLFHMMWDRVYGENGLQDALTRPRNWKIGSSDQRAKVLPLKRVEE